MYKLTVATFLIPEYPPVFCQNFEDIPNLHENSLGTYGNLIAGPLYR